MTSHWSYICTSDVLNVISKEEKHLFCTVRENEWRKPVSLAQTMKWHVRRIVTEHTYNIVQEPLRNDLPTSLPNIENINEDLVINHSTPSTLFYWTGRKVVELGVPAEGRSSPAEK